MRKFNHMKKLIGVMVVLVAMLANLMTPMVVEAAEQTAIAQGTITIKNDSSKSGISIVGKQFSVYRVLDASTASGSSNGYVVNDSFKGFFTGTKANGADPSVNVIFSSTHDAAYVTQVIEYIESYKDNMDAFTKALQEYVSTASNPVTAIAEQSVPANTEEISFDNLEDGYYFILDTTTGNPADGTVRVAAAMNTLAGDEEIEIFVKGSAPTITKENQNNNNNDWDDVWGYQVGDTVQYKLVADIPADITGYETYTYTIADVMESTIDYQNDVKVYLDDAHTTELGASYYTATKVGNGFKLRVEIIDIKTDAVTNLGSSEPLEKIYIIYSGTINETAIDATEPLKNKVTLTYSNDPYNTTTGTVTDTVYHNTFELEVFKVSSQDETNGLANAVFALYKKGSPDKQLFLENVSGTTNYYIDADNNGANDATGVITTGDTGRFIIKGLDDGTEYILKEIKAPENHNPIDPINFTIEATYNADGTVDTSSITPANIGISITDNTASTTIINTTTSLLPSTGGIGTIVVRVAGVAVMIGAVGMFLYLRRKKETLAN